MYKRRYISEIDEHDSFIVVGNTYDALMLSDVISELLPEGKSVKFFNPDEAEGNCDCLFLVDIDELKSVNAKSVYHLTSLQAMFLTKSQIELLKTDWQSIRNCEIELIRLREKGFSLRKSTEDLISYREFLRERVDKEIGIHET